MKKDAETCAALMRSLINALERYDALQDALTAEKKIPLSALQQVVARRQEALKEIEGFISALAPFESLLGNATDETLQGLKRRVIELQATTREHDAVFSDALKARRDQIADQLKALAKAGQAMRGYGGQAHVPPRFLDSLN